MGFSAVSAAIALAGTVVSAMSSQQQQQAQAQQQEYQENMLRRNAVIAEQQATVAEEEGRQAKRDAHDAAVRKRQDAARMVAGERAEMAASGAQVDVGSGLDVAQDVAERGEIDAMRLQEEGERENYRQQLRAWNMRNQSQGLASQANMVGSRQNSGTLDLLGKALGTGERFLKTASRKQVGTL